MVYFDTPNIKQFQAQPQQPQNGIAGLNGQYTPQSVTNANTQGGGGGGSNPFADMLSHVQAYQQFRNQAAAGLNTHDQPSSTPQGFQFNPGMASGAPQNGLRTGDAGGGTVPQNFSFNPSMARMVPPGSTPPSGGGFNTNDGPSYAPQGFHVDPNLLSTGSPSNSTGQSAYQPGGMGTGDGRGGPTPNNFQFDPSMAKLGKPANDPYIDPITGLPRKPQATDPYGIPQTPPPTAPPTTPPGQPGGLPFTPLPQNPAIPPQPAPPPFAYGNTPPPNYSNGAPPFDLNAAYNSSFGNALKQIQGLMQPQFSYESNQLNRNMAAQGAATGNINSGGYAESLGRAQSQLAGQQGSRLSDYVQTASEDAKNRALQQFTAEMQNDTQRYGINTNSQLQEYLQTRAQDLQKYGIDTNALMQAYQSQLQLMGQQYTSNNQFNAQAFQAALQYQLGLAGVDTNRENNLMQYILGMYGLGNNAINSTIGALNGTPPTVGGNVYVKP